MKSNRNLSSVIDSIQDEGPSSSVAADSIAETASVEGPAAAEDSARPSALWITFLCLLLGLAVAGGYLLGSGGLGGYFSSASRAF